MTARPRQSGREAHQPNPEQNRYRNTRHRARAFLSGVAVLRSLAGVLLILNLLLLYGLFFSSGGILGFRQQSTQVRELEEKIQRLKAENHKLFRKIQGFKNDAQAQERLVRQHLGWVRENELMVEFLPSPNLPPQEGKKP